MRRNSIYTKYCVQVFLFILAVTFGASAQADISADERAALIALYDATGGDSWVNTTNKWKTDGVFNAAGTECTWFGVTCDASSITIIKLDLHSNGLNGPIPTTLNDLTGLTELLLGNNSLSGSIPVSLGSLSNLITLSLYINNLTGSIPTTLGGLTVLESLSLTENNLTGEIPVELSNLSNLKTLSLHFNQLTGSIPLPVIPTDLAKLTDLYLEHNQLSGAIPASLGALAKIKFLTLHGNKLSGVIPVALLDATTLTGIDLRYNAVHSTDSSLITALNLKHPFSFPPIDFTTSQTIDADGLVVVDKTASSVDLAWNEVSYVAEEGGYRVYLSPDDLSAFTQHADVTGKDVISTSIAGLVNCTTYFARIHSYTSLHAKNANEVESDGELDDTYGGSDYVVEFKTYGCSAPPVITSVIAIDIPESASIGVTAATVTATDADLDPLSYSITGTTFAINDSGVITVNDILDYETITSYTETVTVSDGVNSTMESVTINVTNVNEIPSIPDVVRTFDIAENTSPYTITSIPSSDPDAGDTLTYSLTGVGNELFSIDDTGALSLIGALDYDTGNTSYDLTVTVTDGGGLFDTALVTINVTDVDESTGSSTAAAGGGGGGGGCSIRNDAEFDPVLLFWLCLSVIYLMRKGPVAVRKLAV